MSNHWPRHTPDMRAPYPYRSDTRLPEKLLTDAQLAIKYAYIPWREPVELETFDGARGLGCRYCIARFGINGSQVNLLPQTLEGHQAHLAQHHSQ